MSGSPAYRVAVLLVLGASMLAACSGSDPAAEGPLAPAATTTAPSASPTRSPTPTPSATPSPTAPPLSPFEADPAVQAFRAYQVAVARAINAGDLAIPELLALSTRERQSVQPSAYQTELGRYWPGPNPFGLLSVTATAPSRTRITACGLDDGWGLTAPGGEPVTARVVVSGYYDMVLDEGVWKVGAVGADPNNSSCEGVDLPEIRFP